MGPVHDLAQLLTRTLRNLTKQTNPSAGLDLGPVRDIAQLLTRTLRNQKQTNKPSSWPRLGTGPRYSPVGDEDVKKPNKPNKQTNPTAGLDLGPVRDIAQLVTRTLRNQTNQTNKQTLQLA